MRRVLYLASAGLLALLLMGCNAADFTQTVTIPHVATIQVPTSFKLEKPELVNKIRDDSGTSYLQLSGEIDNTYYSYSIDAFNTAHSDLKYPTTLDTIDKSVASEEATCEAKSIDGQYVAEKIFDKKIDGATCVIYHYSYTEYVKNIDYRKKDPGATPRNKYVLYLRRVITGIQSGMDIETIGDDASSEEGDFLIQMAETMKRI